MLHAFAYIIAKLFPISTERSFLFYTYQCQIPSFLKLIGNILFNSHQYNKELSINFFEDQFKVTRTDEIIQSVVQYLFQIIWGYHVRCFSWVCWTREDIKQEFIKELKSIVDKFKFTVSCWDNPNDMQNIIAEFIRSHGLLDKRLLDALVKMLNKKKQRIILQNCAIIIINYWMNQILGGIYSILNWYITLNSKQVEFECCS